MRKAFLYIFTFFCINTVVAQQNNSPYSIIGIGDIEKSSFDRTTGMGHAGLALSSERFMYNANPAANASLELHYFYMEVSARFKGVTYSGTPVTSATANNSSDVQFRKLALAVKPKSYWATTLGMLPFSTSKYSMYGLKAIQGTNQSTPAYYEGNGGTTQVFLTNSFKVTKALSLGVQASYIFGHLNEQESILGNVGDSALSSTRYINISNPYFKFGIQYKLDSLGKKKLWDIAFGATGSYQTKLNADYSLSVVDGNSVLRSDNVYKSAFFALPTMYAVGIAATLKNKITFAADYAYQAWGDNNYKGISYRLVNSSRYSFGVQSSKKLFYRDLADPNQKVKSIEKSFLQAGVFYNTSYLQINGYQVDEIGATIGGGFQLSAFFGLNAALEIGSRGTTNNNLIKENFTQFTLTLCYRDFWRARKLIRFD